MKCYKPFQKEAKTKPCHPLPVLVGKRGPAAYAADSFGQAASAAQASKPALHFHTPLALATSGGSKNTVMPAPAPERKDSRCPARPSELHRGGRAKSRALPRPWVFRTKRTLRGPTKFIYFPLVNLAAKE